MPQNPVGGIVTGALNTLAAASQNPFLAEIAAQNTANNANYDVNQPQQTGQQVIAQSGDLGNQQAQQEMSNRLNERQQQGYQDTQFANRQNQLYNAAANSGSARTMMQQQANTLNNMYATAGQRLNDAAAASQQALGNIAQTSASLFRQ